MGNKQNKTPSTELTPDHIVLLQANTKYSEQEIQDLHAGFINDCPDGKLNKDKFIQLYKEIYPNGKAENYCKHAFNTFDTNHDGTISFEEFLLSIAVKSQGNIDDRLGAAFNVYDSSRDGQIDQKELATVLSAMYDLVGETERKGDNDPKKRAADIISKFDAGSDKKLSRDEFISACKSDPYICKLLAPDA